MTALLTTEGAINQLASFLSGSTFRVRGSSALTADSLADLIANEPDQVTGDYQPFELAAVADVANPGKTEPEDPEWLTTAELYQLNHLVIEKNWGASDLCNKLINGTAFNATTNQLTLTAHGLSGGERVIFQAQAGATLPAEIQNATVTARSDFLYVNVFDADTVTLHLTEADGLSGASPIDFGTASGSIKICYATGIYPYAYQLSATQNIIPGSTGFKALGLRLGFTDSDGLLLPSDA